MAVRRRPWTSQLTVMRMRISVQRRNPYQPIPPRTFFQRCFGCCPMIAVMTKSTMSRARKRIGILDPYTVVNGIGFQTARGRGF